MFSLGNWMSVNSLNDGSTLRRSDLGDKITGASIQRMVGVAVN